MPKTTFSRFFHGGQEQHSDLSNGLLKMCKIERATGEIFVEINEWSKNVIQQWTLSDNERYPTANVIQQQTLSDNENYPTTNISRQGKWSDKEHIKNVIQERTLSGKESYPTTRPTTVSKSTESFFSLISSEIFVPTSAGRISIRVLQASFLIRLSWRKKVIWAFLANMLNILSRFIDIPQVVKSWFKVVSIQSVSLQIAMPYCVKRSGSEKVLLERLSLFPEQIAAEIPQWQVLNNLKWSQLSKQLSSSQTFPQL